MGTGPNVPRMDPAWEGFSNNQTFIDAEPNTYLIKVPSRLSAIASTPRTVQQDNV